MDGSHSTLPALAIDNQPETTGFEVRVNRKLNMPDSLKRHRQRRQRGIGRNIVLCLAKRGVRSICT